MGNLSDYFDRKAYRPTYHIGDRVYGKWNKIPFVGTVGNDRLVNEIRGPEITIMVDLPILFDSKLNSVIIVKHKDIKRLKSMDDEEPLNLPVTGSIPDKRTKSPTKSKK